MESQLTESQILDLRAKERTLDGAYWRTSMGLVGASLLGIKIFDRELRYIGAVFVAFGLSMFCIDVFRRYSLRNFQFLPKLIDEQNDVFLAEGSPSKKPYLGEFMTSGNFVFLAGLTAIATYISIIVIIWKHA